MRILVTGAAGFIGYHLSSTLLRRGHSVCGFDNLNNYYDVNLKKARISNLKNQSQEVNSKFHLRIGSLENKLDLKQAFDIFCPEVVVNLAAQAGVRYSITNPDSYIKSNIEGFLNILECCRYSKIEHLVYASSSSVYGGNKKMPFSEKDNVDHPVSLYAVTKKSNELMAHSYSHLYKIPATGLRFFTVYGPWGRPDMALFLFTDAILKNKPIKVFNNGNMIRDFTYIDDIVESLIRIIHKKAEGNKNFDHLNPEPNTSWAPHRLFNIGNSSPVPLMEYIHAIEEELGIIAKKEFLPMQPGDVTSTSADTKKLEEWIEFKPQTKIKDGVKYFIDWYKEFYKI